MKIIVRYCSPWGNFSTHVFEVDSETEIQLLQIKIQERFQIKLSEQLLKAKLERGNIHIIPQRGKQLHEYEITDGTTLFVEQKPQEDSSSASYQVTNRYFTKLGLLVPSKSGIIQEEDEEEKYSEENISQVKSGPKTNTDIQNEEILKKLQRKNSRKLSYQNEYIKLIEDQHTKLLKYAKNGNLCEFIQLLEYKGIPQSIINDNNHEIQEYIIARQNILNIKASDGWNILHYSVYYGHLQIVQICIEKNGDINAETNEGWTPLQLAIHRNQTEITKYLLSQNTLDINKITQKGTALHVAVRAAKIHMIQLLLTYNIQLNLKDSSGQTAADIAINQNIKSLLETPNHVINSNIPFVPPKPPIVKGTLFKTGVLIVNLKKRYFVLNPDDGVLLRYKSKDNYPFKPREVIPLKDISHVSKIKSSWIRKKNLYYFEYFYKSRHIVGSQSKDITSKWVKYIYQAAIYANFLEYSNLDKFSEQKESTKNSILDLDMQLENTRDMNHAFKTSQPVSNDSTEYDNSKISKQQQKGNKQQQLQIEEEEKCEVIVGEPKINLKSFIVQKILGSGAFGKVYKVVKKDNNQVYAMKALKKRQLILKNQLRYAVTECNILKNINHPFILSLHYAFQTPNCLYMVLDYCPYGDLSYHLAQRGTFEEHEARFYVAELILAIEHLHKHNILYRDLKPENILISEDGHIKLADFGLSKEGVTDNQNAQSFCGSPAYLSPEMLKHRSVSKAADIYGVGAVLYEMLCGNPPYYNDDIPKMYENINNAKLTYPQHLSKEAVQILKKLLNRDPKNRLGVKDKSEIKSEPFFKGVDWQQLANKFYKPPKLQNEELEEDEIEKNPKIFLNDFDYNEKNQNQNRVDKFSFVKT